MVEFRIREVAEKKGIMTFYGLQKAMDIAPATAKRLWNSQNMTMIGASTIDQVCRALKCKPGDFIKYEPD